MVRWSASVVLFASLGVASADESSNPAFLGVGMHDMGSVSGSGAIGPCVIDNVTPDSGAAVAGLRREDIIVALDTTQIASCDGLVKAIQEREPGQVVKIQIQRSGASKTLEATLPSRADVLRARFVGKPVPLKTVVRVEDQAIADLGSHGKTTIVGWFDQSRCTTCATAFAKISDWVKAKGPRSSISVMGVTGASMKSVPETVEDLKKVQRSFDVPLLVADADTFTELSINDVKRIHFMVIDCRGIVSYATPLKPDADDRGAVLEELFAATEQAARRMK